MDDATRLASLEKDYERTYDMLQKLTESNVQIAIKVSTLTERLENILSMREEYAELDRTVARMQEQHKQQNITIERLEKMQEEYRKAIAALQPDVVRNTDRGNLFWSMVTGALTILVGALVALVIKK